MEEDLTAMVELGAGLLGVPAQEEVRENVDLIRKQIGRIPHHEYSLIC